MAAARTRPDAAEIAPRAVLAGHPARRRNESRILAAAEIVFAERGYEGATTQLIAERAGLPKANLHYYFPTKEAVYRAVLEQILVHWLGALDDATIDDDPAKVLGGYIRWKLRASFEKPTASQVFAGELLRGAPVIRGFLEGELRDWLARRSRLLEAWAARGLMDPVSPAHLFMLIWAVTQTYADYAPQVLAVLDREQLTEADLEAATATAVHVILKGCGIRGG